MLEANTIEVNVIEEQRKHKETGLQENQLDLSSFERLCLGLCVLLLSAMLGGMTAWLVVQAVQ